MGIEYSLRFNAPDPATVAEVLRGMPTAVEVTLPGGRFDFGGTGHDWPEATAEVEPGGVYFCDHCGGLGRELLAEVVTRLLAAFGPVVVEKL